MTQAQIDTFVRWAVAGVVALIVVHLALRLVVPFGIPGIFLLRDFVNPDSEASFPTWLSSVLWLVAALAATLIGLAERRGGRPRSGWWFAFAAIPLAISIDEVAAVHEVIGRLVQAAFDLGGVFYFAWVIPGALLLVVLAALFFRFLRGLPPEVRLGIVAAGLVAIAGSFGFEMVGSVIYDGQALTGATAYDSVGYLLATSFEELFEFLGALLLLRTLLRHLATDGRGPSLRFELTA